MQPNDAFSLPASASSLHSMLLHSHVNTATTLRPHHCRAFSFILSRICTCLHPYRVDPRFQIGSNESPPEALHWSALSYACVV